MTQPGDFDLSSASKVTIDKEGIQRFPIRAAAGAVGGFTGLVVTVQSQPGYCYTDFPVEGLGTLWIAHAAVTEATTLAAGIPHVGVAHFLTNGCELDQVTNVVRIFWTQQWQWPLPASIGLIIGHIGPGPAISPGPWNNIDLDSGWAQYPVGQTPQFRLLPDGNVQLKGRMTHAAFGGSTTINNANPLPVNFRPAAEVYALRADQYSAGLTISSAGVLTAWPSGNSTTCDINCIYPPSGS